MGEIRRKSEFPRSPLVIIICPKPGFKSSYFNEKRIPKVYKDFIWNENDHLLAESEFHNDVLTGYMNMSYMFGIDWQIYVMNSG